MKNFIKKIIRLSVLVLILGGIVVPNFASAAVAFQSVASNSGDVESLTITKPTGVSVGDTLIAVLVYESVTFDTEPSGWNTIFTNTGEGVSTMKAYWRIATAADVSATDYTWSWTGLRTIAGYIMRIDGAHATTPIGAYQDTSSSANTTPHVLSGITPPANSLLILTDGLYTSSISGGYSNYSITTSNPTWTERVDLYNPVANNVSLAAATALRPEATATGDASVTPSASDHFVGAIIAIQPPVSAPARRILGAGITR